MPYDEGDTARTRSVIGWGCFIPSRAAGAANYNDFVSDTPSERSPAFRCPTGRDTCPKPGVDPIENSWITPMTSACIDLPPGNRFAWKRSRFSIAFVADWQFNKGFERLRAGETQPFLCAGKVAVRCVNHFTDGFPTRGVVGVITPITLTTFA